MALWFSLKGTKIPPIMVTQVPQTDRNYVIDDSQCIREKEELC